MSTSEAETLTLALVAVPVRSPAKKSATSGIAGLSASAIAGQSVARRRVRPD